MKKVTVLHTVQPAVQAPSGFTVTVMQTPSGSAVTVERHIRASNDEEPAHNAAVEALIEQAHALTIRPAHTRPPRRSQRGFGLRPPGVRGAHVRGARVAGNAMGLLQRVEELEADLRTTKGDRDCWQKFAETTVAKLEADLRATETKLRERADGVEAELEAAIVDRDKWRERAEELEADLRTTEADRDDWKKHAKAAVAEARAELEGSRERAKRAETALATIRAFAAKDGS